MAEEKQSLGGGGRGGSVVVVDPKPSKGLTSKVVDFLEKLIVKFMYDTSLPHHYLSGNFAPVHDETPPATDLLVKGFLPVRTINSLPLIVCVNHCGLSSGLEGLFGIG